MSLLKSILAYLFCSLIISTQSCDLVPRPSPPSCLDLETTPSVTTTTSQFGPLIEGCSTNPKGEMFAVNYGNASTINRLGQIHPSQRLWYVDPQPTSWFNGIRFLNESVAFAVDVENHRVIKLDLAIYMNETMVVGTSNYCQNSTMLQPNDLTLSKTGTVFTSGMRWLADTNDTHGDIWSCTPQGQVKLLDVMGRTNGIDLSPDERTLYISESYNRGGTPYVQKIWKYDADVLTGTIENKTLFVDFAEMDGTITVDIDGMKTDVEGNLFVTRHGGRHVVIFDKEGQLIGKIWLSFPNPTNLEFGGPRGTTLFVVGKCEIGESGCVDTIEVVSPGRSWSNLQPAKESVCPVQRASGLNVLPPLVLATLYNR